jgi:uncharacterized membrane protein
MRTAHTHHRHGPAERTSIYVQRRLALATAPFLIATVLGLVLLWPEPAEVSAGAQAGDARRFSATVVEVSDAPCGEIAQGDAFRCYEVKARLDDGPDAGETLTFPYAGGKGSRVFEDGDGILLGHSPNSAGAGSPNPGQPEYFFVDYQRTRPLLILGAMFAIVVTVLSRWRGLAALGGLVISIVVITKFLLPAILEGKSPFLAAIVASAAIMFPALYLAHGLNARTTTALLGTLASLAVTGILAIVFVEATRFTGLASEEATFLQVSADQINLTGLLLGGIIIGSLGVLDDVTITQASAVWELHTANPARTVRELYGSAVRIGRDHIASTVNTLVLAYVGASLPLMVLFTIANRPVGSVLTSEVIAEEIVRTLVGSIGLVASVPITTALACVTVAGRPSKASRPVARQSEPDHDSGEADEVDWMRPRREMDWRRET